MPDVYLLYWLQQLIFLVGHSSILAELTEANNWIQEYTPNFNNLEYRAEPLVKINKIGRLIKKFGELFLFNWLEKIARKFQKTRIDAKPHAPAPAVVISDIMLKFHEQDRREEYQKKWFETITRLS